MGWSAELAFRKCPWCATEVQFTQLSSVNTPTTVSDGRQRFWVLLGCPRCGGAVTVEYSPPNHTPNIELNVLPASTDDQYRVSDAPEDVENYYRDALRVLQIGVPDAAAVQLRRTLEAAAAHFGVKSFPLVKAIRDLIAQGLITAQFGDVLGHIRDLGNMGAHATDRRLTQEEVERALRFTTQVLRNLFEVPAELRRLGAAPDPEDGTAAQVEDPS